MFETYILINTVTNRYEYYIIIYYNLKGKFINFITNIPETNEKI